LFGEFFLLFGNIAISMIFNLIPFVVFAGISTTQMTFGHGR